MLTAEHSIGVGWVGPAVGVCPDGLWVLVLVKYLDPAGDGDRNGHRTRHMAVLKFSGLGGARGHE